MGIRWHIKFGSEGIDTCLVLAEGLVASACQGINVHQLAMDQFVSRVLGQQRCKECNSPAILMSTTSQSRESQTCLTLPAAECVTRAERPLGLAAIWQSVTGVERKSGSQGCWITCPHHRVKL